MHQATALADECRAHGLEPIIAPAIAIEFVQTDSLHSYLNHITDYRLSIFVSANAARAVADAMADTKADTADKTPPSLPAIAIGRATAAALPACYQLTLPADDAIADGQQLLARLGQLPPLAPPRASKIAIIGGAGPNSPIPSPALTADLQQQGHLVDSIITYQRCPLPPHPTITQLGERQQIAAAIAYSTDTVHAMLKMCSPSQQWLLQTPLFVIHSNIAHNARQLGFKKVICLANANNPAQTIANYLS